MKNSLRSAMWHLYRHWRSTLTCLIFLSLGIGVVTSTVSIMNGILLRPLPFVGAERLVVVRTEVPNESLFNQQSSRLDFLDWQKDCTTMDLTAVQLGRFDLVFDGGFERIYGLYVDPSFFEVMRIRPHLGGDFRGFETNGNRQVVMFGTSVWQERFDAQKDIIGTMVEMKNWSTFFRNEGQHFAVTGLLPQDMRMLPSSGWFNDRGMGPDQLLEYVMPMDLNRGSFSDRNFVSVDVVGRLEPGVTLQQAQAEMSLLCHRLAERFPESNKDRTARVVPLNDYVFASIQPFVVAAFIAALLVFAIAVANVMHLLLVLYQNRQGEMAIRAAVGATPGRIVQQVMLEFAALLFGSLLLGLAIGRGCTDVLMTMAPTQLRWLPTPVSFDEVLLVIGIASLAGLFVWYVALRKVMSPNLMSLLSASSRSASGDKRAMRTLRWMTEIQLLATYVLLLGAGLLWLRTRELSKVDLGFTAKNRLTMVVSLPQGKYEWVHNSVFCNDVIRRVRNVTGVYNAGAILGLPIGGNSQLQGQVVIEGRPPIRRADLPTTYIRVVTDDYFETMGIPLIAGRKFNATDGIGEIGANRTAIVSQTMVDRCWPGKDPVGRRFKPFSGFNLWMEVVGVVGDVHGGGIERGPSIEIYYPEKLYPQSVINLVVHTEIEPMAMAGEIRRAVLQADGEALITDVKSMNTVLQEAQADRHFGFYLLTFLAVLGLTFAGFGVIFTTAHAIVCRKDELHVRIACGATPWDIVSLIVRQHAKSVVLAIGLGMFVAISVTSSLSLPWEEIRFFRVLSTAFVPVTLGVAALGASLIVACRMAFSVNFDELLRQ